MKKILPLGDDSSRPDIIVNLAHACMVGRTVITGDGMYINVKSLFNQMRANMGMVHLFMNEALNGSAKMFELIILKNQVMRYYMMVINGKQMSCKDVGKVTNIPSKDSNSLRSMHSMLETVR